MNSEFFIDQSKGNITPTLFTSKIAPLDTPTSFIKRPVPSKSPSSKEPAVISRSNYFNSKERGILSNEGQISEANKEDEKPLSPQKQSQIATRQDSIKNQGNLMAEKEIQNQNKQNNYFANFAESRNLFASPIVKKDSFGMGQGHSFHAFSLTNITGSNQKYMHQSSQQVNASADFLKSISSPIITKGYSGIKFSPATSPFIIKTMGHNCASGVNNMKEHENEHKGLSCSFYNMQLFSPAQEKETPVVNFKSCTRTESEICGRRLFQSPSSQFKSTNHNPSVNMVTKRGTRITSSKLEDIMEEDQNFSIENHQNNYEAHQNDAYFYNHHSLERNLNNNNNASLNRNNNLDIMIHDEEMKGFSAFGGSRMNIYQGSTQNDEILFATPSCEQPAGASNQNNYMDSSSQQTFSLGKVNQKLYRNSTFSQSGQNMICSNQGQMSINYEQQNEFDENQMQFSQCNNYSNYYDKYQKMKSSKKLYVDGQPMKTKNVQRYNRAGCFQKIDLSKANFINSTLNIQVQNINNQIDNENFQFDDYDKIPLKISNFPIQINQLEQQQYIQKQKVSSGKKHNKGSSNKKKHSGLKRTFTKHLKSSGKKQKDFNNNNMATAASSNTIMSNNNAIMSSGGCRSNQKQHMKKQSLHQHQLQQQQQQMYMINNAGGATVFNDLSNDIMMNSNLLQTPKSCSNIQREANMISAEHNGTNMQSSTFKSPLQVQNSENKSASGKIICNCKKSKCLKLYCDCFAFGQGCGPECNCIDCSNTEENEERKLAIDAILDRNPNAFKPKIEQDKGFHTKGCHCKKSGCLKKYCECYQSGVPCTNLCICEGCKNCEGGEKADDLSIYGNNNMDRDMELAEGGMVSESNNQVGSIMTHGREYFGEVLILNDEELMKGSADQEKLMKDQTSKNLINSKLVQSSPPPQRLQKKNIKDQMKSSSPHQYKQQSPSLQEKVSSSSNSKNNNNNDNIMMETTERLSKKLRNISISKRKGKRNVLSSHKKDFAQQQQQCMHEHQQQQNASSLKHQSPMISNSILLSPLNDTTNKITSNTKQSLKQQLQQQLEQQQQSHQDSKISQITTRSSKRKQQIQDHK